MKKGFIIYHDIEEALLNLTDQQAGILFKMIVAYSSKNELIEKSDPVVDIVFKLIKAQINRDREKYTKKCEANQLNGMKGGRPPSETQPNPNNPVGFDETQITQSNPTKPKKADRDRDSLSLSVKDKEELNPSAKPREVVQQDFLESLRSSQAYEGIDVERELAKMDVWLSLPKNRGRKKTQRFIINWLNRVERPIKQKEEKPTVIISKVAQL